MKTIPHKFMQGITAGDLDLIADEDLTITVMNAIDATHMMRDLRTSAQIAKESAESFTPGNFGDIRVPLDEAVEMKNVAYVTGYLHAIELVERELAISINRKKVAS